MNLILLLIAFLKVRGREHNEKRSSRDSMKTECRGVGVLGDCCDIGAHSCSPFGGVTPASLVVLGKSLRVVVFLQVN